MNTLTAAAGAAILLAGCAVAPSTGFHDAARIDDPDFPGCFWTQRYTPPVVYLESDFVRAYLAPTDLVAYRQAIPAALAMPPRPMIRVSVLHFYGMENGPVYHESEVSVLALYQGQPGWFVLTMPVTDGDACAGGRNALGTPKVMRRITLERAEDRYVGTSYARGGRAVDFALAVDVRETAEAAREVLRFATPFPDFYLLRGRIVRVGGLRAPLEDMARAVPDIWTVKAGEGRLEYAHEPDNLLQRLGVGSPLASYWARMRYRYSITPR
jgi:hypothetical protein